MNTIPLTDANVIKFYGDVIMDPGKCWLWSGRHSAYGYALFMIERHKQVAAHRVSYFLDHGVWTNCLDHLCRNRGCVNPDHLEAVSIKENNLRGMGAPAVNGRKTHCKHGHLLAGDNLKLIPNGRACRECRRIRWHSRHDRPLAEFHRELKEQK